MKPVCRWVVARSGPALGAGGRQLGRGPADPNAQHQGQGCALTLLPTATHCVLWGRALTHHKPRPPSPRHRVDGGSLTCHWTLGQVAVLCQCPSRIDVWGQLTYQSSGVCPHLPALTFLHLGDWTVPSPPADPARFNRTAQGGPDPLFPCLSQNTSPLSSQLGAAQ